MQTSLRIRLFLNTLAVLLAGMTLAAILSWLAVERLYLSTQQENLLAQARLTAAALQGMALPTDPVNPYSQTSNVLPGIHTRLLTEQGGVAISFPLPPGQASVQVPSAELEGSVSPAELLQRPEVRQALKGQASSATRRVQPAGRNVLYAVAPISGENGEITGIVYSAMPLPPAGLPSTVIMQFAGAVLLAVGLASVAGVLHIDENSWSYYNGGWYGQNSSNLWTQNTIQNASPSGETGSGSDAEPVSLGQISVRAEVSVTFSLK